MTTIFSLLLFFVPSLSPIQSASALVKSWESSTVYFIDASGQRHAFPTEDIFFSWYEDFSSVVEVSAQELSAYPLRQNMRMKPCSYLVKVLSSPDVYAVESGGILRLLEEEEQAENFFGEEWAQIVHDVSDVFWTDYTLGAPLTVDLPDGCLVKQDSSPSVYFTQDGSSYLFENEDVFTYSRMLFEHVHIPKDSALIHVASSLIDHSDRFSQLWEQGSIVLNVAALEPTLPSTSDVIDTVKDDTADTTTNTDDQMISEPPQVVSTPPSQDTLPSTTQKSVSTVSRISYDVVSDPLDRVLLESMYGPRIAASTDTYDFHQGVDLSGEIGDKVYAIADGEIYRTYLASDVNSPYPNSGNIVILRHSSDVPISHYGSHTVYYSLYAHLDSITVPLETIDGSYLSLSRGSEVGAVGATGSALSPHLHFEIRIGTTCSYQTQVASPTSSCAQTFTQFAEPNVNPLLFMDYPNQDSLDVEVVSEDPLMVDVSFDNDELDFNQLSVAHGQGETTMVNFTTLDGIDPSNIDVSSYNDVELQVEPIDTAPGAQHTVRFIFHDISDSWISLTASDIWGSSVTLFQ